VYRPAVHVFKAFGFVNEIEGSGANAATADPLDRRPCNLFGVVILLATETRPPEATTKMAPIALQCLVMATSPRLLRGIILNLQWNLGRYQGINSGNPNSRDFPSLPTLYGSKPSISASIDNLVVRSITTSSASGVDADTRKRQLASCARAPPARRQHRGYNSCTRVNRNPIPGRAP
jgi:hypothetical protein